MDWYCKLCGWWNSSRNTDCTHCAEIAARERTPQQKPSSWLYKRLQIVRERESKEVTAS